MNRVKVMTIVGTRPEVIRLSRVLPALDRATDHVLVHTGQNHDRELNAIFFEELELRAPDYHLDAACDMPAETIGRVIIGADRVLATEQPDALLVLGDTDSGLAAIAAKRRRIPVFHMEAGNRCFDERVPEEINRRLIDHVADVNLPYSSIAREYLLAEGFPADRIIKTGSPLFEVINHYRLRIDGSDVLKRLGLKPRKYFVVSMHRAENVDSDERIRTLVATLASVAEEFSEPILVSTHPRTRKRIDALGLEFHQLVRLMKPFGFLDYCSLQLNAHAVLSDSGSISEESAILGFPALNLRDTHERPEAMEQGVVVMTGLSSRRVLQSLAILDERSAESASPPRLPPDYAVPDVSAKLITIILSYIDYVRRTIWKDY
ncbi:MAG TPA: UDP-N-acetylglucosamine 2-epimerase (non-hydrolyzing) [Sphingomicrobium sp.]|jgi:UDP-N-acetylglucosamine 2-epimerase (non-hydrolysing)|nr:UDP-N-acetylglucosamine 2-epimerase (non-hydrolyzing) [Sphingomicrobium sp.]